jgi:hypothetical protein
MVFINNNVFQYDEFDVDKIDAIDGLVEFAFKKIVAVVDLRLLKDLQFPK